MAGDSSRCGATFRKERHRSEHRPLQQRDPSAASGGCFAENASGQGVVDAKAQARVPACRRQACATEAAPQQRKSRSLTAFGMTAIVAGARNPRLAMLAPFEAQGERGDGPCEERSLGYARDDN